MTDGSASIPDPYAVLAGVYDELVVDPCFASWADYAERTWDGDPAGVRRVLDLCCGTGRMAAELRDRGYRVSGLDASAAMLGIARGRLGRDVPLVLAVLPDLPSGPATQGPIDAVVSTYDGLNYLTAPALAATFRALAGRLRPGGWLVFDVHAERMLDIAEDTPVVLGEHAGTAYAIAYVVDRPARTCRAVFRIGSGETGAIEEHRQYLHSADTVRAALTEAGFAVVATTANYTDAPADDTTLRTTWTARRAR